MLYSQGHRQRLRERLRSAPESLRSDEVLELLLGYVLLRKDVKPIAKEMLARCKSLNGVLRARSHELLAVDGAGPRTLDFLLLLRELIARLAETPLRTRELLCTPQAVAHMARQRLGHAEREEVWVAYVDSQNRLIAWEKAIQGSVHKAMVIPRDILSRALTVNAAGFIMVHNHPGGTPKPSRADLSLTRDMETAAQALEIRFLDHVIVTATAHYSIKSEGLLR
jgi:DNA repair protein RadC